jgi:hypothetical protein
MRWRADNPPVDTPLVVDIQPEAARTDADNLVADILAAHTAAHMVVVEPHKVDHIEADTQSDMALDSRAARTLAGSLGPADNHNRVDTGNPAGDNQAGDNHNLVAPDMVTAAQSEAVCFQTPARR